MATVLAVGIVKRERFNRFLSSPHWSPEQEEAADDLLASVEDGLASALFGTVIEPIPFTETAPIIARSGQVQTRYPVYAVTALNGITITPVDPDDPTSGVLPQTWSLVRHRLFRSPAFPAYGSGGPRWNGDLLTQVPDQLTPATYDDVVELSYLAGWGPDPTLVLAIMRKAKAIFLNNHDDTIIARGTTADPPQPVASEDWTDAELAPLGRYRRLALGNT